MNNMVTVLTTEPLCLQCLLSQEVNSSHAFKNFEINPKPDMGEGFVNGLAGNFHSISQDSGETKD